MKDHKDNPLYAFLMDPLHPGAAYYAKRLETERRKRHQMMRSSSVDERRLHQLEEIHDLRHQSQLPGKEPARRTRSRDSRSTIAAWNAGADPGPWRASPTRGRQSVARQSATRGTGNTNLQLRPSSAQRRKRAERDFVARNIAAKNRQQQQRNRQASASSPTSRQLSRSPRRRNQLAAKQTQSPRPASPASNHRGVGGSQEEKQRQPQQAAAVGTCGEAQESTEANKRVRARPDRDSPLSMSSHVPDASKQAMPRAPGTTMRPHSPRRLQSSGGRDSPLKGGSRTSVGLKSYPTGAFGKPMLSDAEAEELEEQKTELAALVGKKVVVVDDGSMHYRRIGILVKLNRCNKLPVTGQVRFEADFGRTGAANYRFGHGQIKLHTNRRIRINKTSPEIGSEAQIDNLDSSKNSQTAVPAIAMAKEPHDSMAARSSAWKKEKEARLTAERAREAAAINAKANRIASIMERRKKQQHTLSATEGCEDSIADRDWAWKQAREMRLADERQRAAEEEMAGVTFKPNINRFPLSARSSKRQLNSVKGATMITNRGRKSNIPKSKTSSSRPKLVEQAESMPIHLWLERIGYAADDKCLLGLEYHLIETVNDLIFLAGSSEGSVEALGREGGAWWDGAAAAVIWAGLVTTTQNPKPLVADAADSNPRAQAVTELEQFQSVLANMDAATKADTDEHSTSLESRSATDANDCSEHVENVHQPIWHGVWRESIKSTSAQLRTVQAFQSLLSSETQDSGGIVTDDQVDDRDSEASKEDVAQCCVQITAEQGKQDSDNVSAPCREMQEQEQQQEQQQQREQQEQGQDQERERTQEHEKEEQEEEQE
eukprot:SAG31_NODE_4138_length_3544_cov_28.705951_3_plen_829_part_01